MVAASMTSMSSISILSQSPNERRRSGRASNSTVLSIRAEGSGTSARARGRTVKFCAAIWSLRVSMTARNSGSASASAHSTENRAGRAGLLVAGFVVRHSTSVEVPAEVVINGAEPDHDQRQPKRELTKFTIVKQANEYRSRYCDIEQRAYR